MFSRPNPPDGAQMEHTIPDGNFRPGLREITKGTFSSGEGPVQGVRLEFSSGIAAVCKRSDLSAADIDEIHRLAVLYTQEVEKAERTPAMQAGAASLAEQLRGLTGSLLGYSDAAGSEADAAATEDVAGLGALLERLKKAPEALADQRRKLAQQLRALGVVLVRHHLKGFPLENGAEVARAA